MEKFGFGIRDKHPGSATLQVTVQYFSRLFMPSMPGSLDRGFLIITSSFTCNNNKNNNSKNNNSKSNNSNNNC